jgi:hypothetical protein
MKDVCTFIEENNAQTGRGQSIVHRRLLAPLTMPSEDRYDLEREHDRAVARYLRTVGLE